jgi:hypothetical protein
VDASKPETFDLILLLFLYETPITASKTSIADKVIAYIFLEFLLDSSFNFEPSVEVDFLIRASRSVETPSSIVFISPNKFLGANARQIKNTRRT